MSLTEQIRICLQTVTGLPISLCFCPQILSDYFQHKHLLRQYLKCGFPGFTQHAVFSVSH